MTETIQRKLNDSAAARWTALVLVASMMFFGYMFVDVMSPLQSLIEQERGWSPDVFGTYAAGEYILNVFGFLIIAGIILDKCGIRFTGELSASMMFIGACIKYYAISDSFAGTALATWLDSWWISMPASAKLASFGFMIFGCGCEMAGTTVSKAIAKWFKGKEMALAMGLEMAIARVGVFAIFSISPIIAEKMGSVSAPVGFCTVLLFIGLITFSVFCVMDRKFDKQLGTEANGGESEEEFKTSDLKNILTSRIFWVVALLCVLYYSAIFPFQRYGANMLQCNLDGISPSDASNIFRWFPIGAAVITPFLGSFLDHKAKEPLCSCGVHCCSLPATSSSPLCCLQPTAILSPTPPLCCSASRLPSYPQPSGPAYPRLSTRKCSAVPTVSSSGCRTLASVLFPCSSVAYWQAPMPTTLQSLQPRRQAVSSSPTTIPCRLSSLRASVWQPYSCRLPEVYRQEARLRTGRAQHQSLVTRHPFQT